MLFVAALLLCCDVDAEGPPYDLFLPGADADADADAEAVPGAQYGAGITREVACPKSMVGRVIGKGGETIKALQKNFGANIQIDQSTEPMKVTVSGQPQAVDLALGAVQEIINGGSPYLGPGSGGFGAPAAWPASDTSPVSSTTVSVNTCSEEGSGGFGAVVVWLALPNTSPGSFTAVLCAP